MSDTSIPAPKDPLSVGDQVLDRYRVTERLAIGGHSIVYRGDDKRLSRPVCIKVFHNLAESDGVWRASYEHFVQEAFALSKLTHPNTLRIYDFGHLAPEADSEQGAPFQVSEYMNGGTLSRLVRREGPLFDGRERPRHHRAVRGAGRGPRRRNHPSRHQAAEHPVCPLDPVAHGQARRLRHRQVASARRGRARLLGR